MLNFLQDHEIFGLTYSFYILMMVVLSFWLVYRICIKKTSSEWDKYFLGLTIISASNTAILLSEYNKKIYLYYVAISTILLIISLIDVAIQKKRGHNREGRSFFMGLLSVIIAILVLMAYEPIAVFTLQSFLEREINFKLLQAVNIFSSFFS